MRFSLLVSFALFFCFNVHAQINQNGIPFITNYSPQEYGASQQNWAIVQDNRGVMYFGNNDNGVLEYDGVTWRKIKSPNNSIIRSLAVDSAGRIYVGAVGEFGFLNPDKEGAYQYISLLSKVDSSDLGFSDMFIKIRFISVLTTRFLFIKMEI